MNKYIVITSINPPSEAIHRFRTWPGWQLIVVGDRKTPPNWASEGVKYLSVEEQYDCFGELANAIPVNSYKRKMLGYLYAIKQGAVAILESDDDNIPYADAQLAVERDLASARISSAVVAAESGWINIYKEFGADQAWPRGYPLELIHKSTVPALADKAGLPWGVMQYLADEDPDVDAIFRLTQPRPIFFARERSLRLAMGTFSPFNSQATLWLPEVYPLLFLPLGVTDRVTDILRGYIALASLWRCSLTLGVSSPIVYQHRNEHNLLRDFDQEIEIYRNADRWSRQLLLWTESQRTPVAAFEAGLAGLIREKALPPENSRAYSLFLAALSSTS